MSEHTEFDVLHAKLVAAWASGDAEAYAGCFTDDATYVAFDGDTFIGRDGIAKSHRPLFAKWLKGSRLVQEQLSVRRSGDVFIAHGMGAVLPKGRSTISDSRRSTQTYVAVKTADGLKFAAFQNTRYRPFAKSLLGRLMNSLNRPSPQPSPHGRGSSHS